ncbi:MAG: hypothetical protein JSW64_07500 [Candidatus Zixiibacteriota bacterium]|nr:MAG: hypothetical protein JSW64_07500 [candidate division Zixibacteria bacterium]
MRRVTFVFAVTMFFLYATISVSFAQIDAGRLLKRMIDARGGKSGLSNIKSCVMKGKIVLVSQGSTTGEVTVAHMYPDKTLIEMNFAGTSIRQGYDGDVAWIDNPQAGGYQELPAMETQAMKYQALGDDAFLNPGKYGISYTYKGIKTDSAAGFYMLEQSFGDGFKTILYYVDMGTYLVHKTETNKGTPAQPFIEEVYYGDYRKTDNIAQAHRISTFVNGQESIRFLFDRIEYNVDIDTGIFQAAEKRFTRGELIADARQLADIIEDTHPDPYEHIGGKIAFHRSFQHILHAIPEDGMTGNQFKTLLRPFVAAIGDAHTEVYTHYNVNIASPGGIPLKFDVVERSLYVSGVPEDQYGELLGAILVSVENVSIEELGKRLKTLTPIDNEYHLLWHFTTNYLWYGPYLQELLPEWEDTKQVRVELLLSSGETREVEFNLPMAVALLSEPESQIALPSTPESGFTYDYLGPDKRIAYVPIDHMKYYRESFEARNSLGLEHTPQEKLDSIPSATEFFRSLVTEMKDVDTETMIVDLRRNGGGDALMVDIMLYFLYGKDTTVKTRWNNIDRLSKIYLESRKGITLEGINKDRVVSLTEGDYDFSQDYSDDLLCKTSALAEGFTHSPTFFTEWENGTFEGYYCPEHVIVLTRPWTFSAGFGIAVRLYRAGAILVGTPSSQAPNSGGNAIRWKLNNTGVIGRVSQSYALNFLDDSEQSRVLPVHYPLKYEWLASHDFDPNAEVLYALELLSKLK